MKRYLSLVFFFLTGLLFSQEFGSQFYTIDDNSLPQVLSINNNYFVQKHTESNFSKSMGITSSNYWKPVSMTDALNQQDAYLNRKNTTEKKLTAESLGFKKVIEKESAIRIEVRDPYYKRRSGVRNTVYKDASMPLFYNPFYYRPTTRQGL